MQILKLLLSPITLLYKLITDFRNHLYNIGHSKSFTFEIPLISVGNLTVGGTGKTPHIEYLIRLLASNFKTAVLSRGYGRKTKGFIFADESVNASIIGDEPMQYYLKYGKDVVVSVCESRAFAVPLIVYEQPETNVILLDDAFQHRKVKPQLNILLSDYNRPFYEDYLLPSGLLRESRSGAKRADIVIVSKCPEKLSITEKSNIVLNISKYSGQKPVFFTKVTYGKAISLNNNLSIEDYKNVVLFAGLATIIPFQNYISTQFNLLKTIDLKDHHKYQLSDLELIKSNFLSFKDDEKCLITTEKDMVKLLDSSFNDLLNELPIFYIPIEISFLEKENEFNDLILNVLK